MARYIVTSGSHFQPLTYDELIKPLAQMTEAQNNAQAAYDQISMETNALENYITQNPEDERARELYDNYKNKLTALQSNLWNNGYSSQTARDLSAARAGYASDITRLSTAIKNRQERSKEYWDMRHKNPDMVAGNDPGTAGLDNYLDNDRYGQDYFNYSGDKFTTEVATDAKAMASEMLKSKTIKDPDAVGHLMRIETEGYTAQEAYHASSAVEDLLFNGNGAALDNLTLPEQLLAKTLISHMQSTGAEVYTYDNDNNITGGNLSADEYRRLFEYGKAGIKHAIGKTTTKDLTDNEYAYNKQIALENLRHKHNKEIAGIRAGAKGGSSSRSGSGRGAYSDGNGYSMDEISTFIKNKRSTKATGTISKHFLKPFENSLVLKNGSVLSNYQEAEEAINALGRQDILSTFNIDPIDMKGITHGTYEGQEIRISPLAQGQWAVYKKGDDGKWHSNSELSKKFDSMLSDFNTNLNTWKAENPNIKLDDLIISNRDWSKIRKDNNIPDSVKDEDIPYVLATLSGIGNVSALPIAPTDGAFDTTRANYASHMIEAHNRAKAQNGKLSKTDWRLFYPVEKGEVSKTGVTADKVFGKDAKKELSSVHAYPEDIIGNKVRISANGKEYVVHASMLGNNMDAQVRALTDPVSSHSEFRNLGISEGTVEELMLPIVDPSRTLSMSDEDATKWLYVAQGCLGRYLPFAKYGITPDDIVRSPQLQGELRTAVNKFITSTLSDARDEMMLNNYQVRGNTSSKAEEYNEDIEDYLF